MLLAGCMGQALPPADSADGAQPTDAGGGSADSEPSASADSGSGAGTDAGPDGGPVASDAGADGGCSGTFICDDFEADTAGAAPQGWGVTLYPANAGDITIDTTRTHSGSQSVHIRATLANFGNAIVQMRHGLSLPSNAYFGRMWLFMPVRPQPHHWDLLASWGHLPGTPAIQANEIYLQYGGGVQIGSPMLPDGGPVLSAYYLSQNTDCEQASLDWMPPQQWVCVEWQFDGINSEMRFWMNGQLASGLTVTNPRTGCGGTWTAPTFERLDLGWYNAQPQSGVPLEMWIDDVAAGMQRVGCGP
jgi:hypothetical protein